MNDSCRVLRDLTKPTTYLMRETRPTCERQDPKHAFLSAAGKVFSFPPPVCLYPAATVSLCCAPEFEPTVNLDPNKKSYHWGETCGAVRCGALRYGQNDKSVPYLSTRQTQGERLSKLSSSWSRWTHFAAILGFVEILLITRAAARIAQFFAATRVNSSPFSIHVGR